jgi:hypothetical protein
MVIVNITKGRRSTARRPWTRKGKSKKRKNRKQKKTKKKKIKGGSEKKEEVRRLEDLRQDRLKKEGEALEKILRREAPLSGKPVQTLPAGIRQRIPGFVPQITQGVVIEVLCDFKLNMRIHLNNVIEDLDNYNLIGYVDKIERVKPLGKFTELEKPLNDYINKLERVRLFNYREFLNTGIVHQFTSHRLPSEKVMNDYLRKSKSIFLNRNISIGGTPSYTTFHLKTRERSTNLTACTRFVKFHISVKFEYLWDALELLNQYEGLDDHFPEFKFVLPRYHHVEYKNKIGILGELEDEKFKEYVNTYAHLAGATLAANIVLYPNEVYGEDGKENLLKLKTEVLDPFITWWNKQDKQKRWGRDRNYLYFSIRLGETLFMAYGHDTESRLNCYDETNRMVRDRKCINFTRKKPIKVMQNLQNKYCSRSADVKDADEECLSHYFNLTEEQLCKDREGISFADIYGLRDDIGNPPMETDLYYGDTFCSSLSDIVDKRHKELKVASAEQSHLEKIRKREGDRERKKRWDEGQELERRREEVYALKKAKMEREKGGMRPQGEETSIDEFRDAWEKNVPARAKVVEYGLSVKKPGELVDALGVDEEEAKILISRSLSGNEEDEEAARMVLSVAVTKTGAEEEAFQRFKKAALAEQAEKRRLERSGGSRRSRRKRL